MILISKGLFTHKIKHEKTSKNKHFRRNKTFFHVFITNVLFWNLSKLVQKPTWKNLKKLFVGKFNGRYIERVWIFCCIEMSGYLWDSLHGLAADVDKSNVNKIWTDTIKLLTICLFLSVFSQVHVWTLTEKKL